MSCGARKQTSFEMASMSYGRVIKVCSTYRVLYFFSLKAAVLAHGIIKERQVPDIEIQRARKRKSAFEANPDFHTYRDAAP